MDYVVIIIVAVGIIGYMIVDKICDTIQKIKREERKDNSNE